jgi:hypothetical protein
LSEGNPDFISYKIDSLASELIRKDTFSFLFAPSSIGRMQKTNFYAITINELSIKTVFLSLFIANFDQFKNS